MSEKPDLLVSPNGQTACNAETVGADELAGYLARGWRLVPFEQHVEEQSPLIEAAAIEAAVAGIATSN